MSPAIDTSEATQMTLRISYTAVAVIMIRLNYISTNRYNLVEICDISSLHTPLKM